MSSSSSKVGASPPAVDSKQLESNQFSSVEDSADHLLETLGYTPELSRNRSTAQVAFMSFVLASIPYGLATTLYYPLLGGGPVDIIWGWVLVSLIIICVAASLGEITSVYPTAGGISRQSLSPFCFWILRHALRNCRELSHNRKI
jgi:amino acid permease